MRRYDAKTRTKHVISHLRDDRTLANRTDIHGRDIFPTISDHRLDIRPHADGLGFDLTHRADDVGTFRVEDAGEMSGVIRPADESWATDCQDIADRMGSVWFDVKVEGA